MAAVKNSNSKREKNTTFELDWPFLFDDPSDDRPPELFITSSKKLKSENQHDDYQSLTDTQLKSKISDFKAHISRLGPKCKDNGEKLKANLRRLEAESKRRQKNNILGGDKKDRIKREESVQLSDESDDGASCRKDRKDQKSSAPSKFARSFFNKIDENERTVNAFENEMHFINPCQGRKTSQNGRFINNGRSSQQSSSRSKEFQCPTTLDDRKYKISNSDEEVIRSATSPLRQLFTNRTPAPEKDKPLTKLKPKPPSSYHLVDEDIEDPCVSNTTLYAEKLSDCMKDVQVCYPSRDDRDQVEVTYTDMECLAPEACLSSTIMNFYIRYLQQTSSENRTCNYHFFNTYFYNKLQKLNYRGDSFLKFRKWWKGVNIYEKAYILLPVHECAHWSLGIICIPTKEDEVGPIVLHLDSLGLHDSNSISDKIRRFLKEEWSYLRNLDDPLDPPITDEIWENLGHRISNRKVQVPQQRNAYDCGLFVLYYMERFIKEAPQRLTEKDLSMFGKQWFPPEEASNLRVRIHNLLVQEFKIAKDKETILESKC